MGVLSVSDDLLRRVETVARRHEVSVERKAEELLSIGLATLDEPRAPNLEPKRDETRADLIRRLQELRDMTPKGVKQTDSVILLREDRDR